MTTMAKNRSEQVHEKLTLEGGKAERPVNDRCMALANPEKYRLGDYSTCYELSCVKWTGKEYLAVKKILPAPMYQGHPTLDKLPPGMLGKDGQEELVKVKDGSFWSSWDSKFIALVKKRMNRWFSVADINPDAM